MAKTKLEIDINAKNNTGPALKGVTNSLDDMVGKVDGALQSITGFSLAQVTIAGAVAKVSETVVSAVEDYSAYVEQVDKMSMATGMASEQTSRLIQLADDFRVETSSLERSMVMALQNGFNPTVENLAKLSDEYLAIQDPTERAAKMQDIFGRSWKDMVPLLERGGDAIRSASDGIADSLVVTQDAIDANREYVAAMDELNDAWTGTKNELARGLIPALTDLIQTNNRMEASVDENALAWMRYTPVLSTFYNIIMGVSAATDEAAGSSEELAEALPELEGAMGAAADVTGDAAEQAKEFADETAAIQKEIDGLIAKQQSWQGGVGKKVADLLEDSGVKGNQYDQALLTIDKTMGTNLDTQRRMDESMQSLVDKYAAGELSQKEFEIGLRQLRDAFDPTTRKIDDAKAKLQQLEAQLLKMSDIHLRIDVSVEGGGVSTGGGSSSPVTGGGGGSGGPIHQPTSMRGGSSPTYNLTVNTSQSPDLVIDSFAAMRALNYG